MAQGVGRGIALLFHDRGTRRGLVVSSTPRSHFTPGKDPVPILQEAGWAPGVVWTAGKSLPHRDSIPERPARSQSLYRLSYPAHYIYTHTHTHTYIQYIFIHTHSYIAPTRFGIIYSFLRELYIYIQSFIAPACFGIIYAFFRQLYTKI